MAPGHREPGNRTSPTIGSNCQLYPPRPIHDAAEDATSATSRWPTSANSPTTSKAARNCPFELEAKALAPATMNVREMAAAKFVDVLRELAARASGRNGDQRPADTCGAHRHRPISWTAGLPDDAIEHLLL